MTRHAFATPTRMRERIAALGPWFHNLHLPDGVETAPEHPLGDFPNYKWRQLAPHLPERLEGCTVLDIGCNAGFYSFALAARGADVLGIDCDEHYLAQARWARTVFGADRVEFRRASVYEIGDLGCSFDIVVFMGVLYHLRYPMLALDLIASLTPRLLVFQTLTHGGDVPNADTGEDFGFEQRGRFDAAGWPRMAFIEHTFCGDPTNWWVPNLACAEAMLRSAGFEVVARPGHELLLCKPSPNARSLLDRSALERAAAVPRNDGGASTADAAATATLAGETRTLRRSGQP